MQQIPDNTPIIVGAGQYTEHIRPDTSPRLSGPMDIIAQAAREAMKDAGGTLNARHIDTIATIRLFSDSVPMWACPFGGSDNPPESVARRIGASPKERICSDANGAEPLKLLAELFASIARGEINCALLTGGEAIASQRHALRHSVELNWSEQIEVPMDGRLQLEGIASPQEFASGMYLPAHYYALIENARAAKQGNTPAQHQRQMANLMAPFSAVAKENPYAYWQEEHTAEELMAQGKHNYPISLPYSKLLVAQDAVNQGAALVLTSTGKAREWGIPSSQWIFLEGYAEGTDQYPSERQNPGSSSAMEQVIKHTLETTGAKGDDFDLIDIYSCFPCAVEAACDALSLPIDGSRRLTVTGGLPFFGGPGSNYSMHALAEMARQLRATEQRALVTANGGILSKHAAAVLTNKPSVPLLWTSDKTHVINPDSIASSPVAASPETGKVISYTVIYERKKADLAVILGETDTGERFLANSDEPTIVEWMKQSTPVGRSVRLTSTEGRNQFEWAKEG